ncbi:NUDIX hydrolase [Microvirga aerophila]|uniref:NUDIX hydrolase n=1 Tax=Microvirga aerophila TaxID=670291 RepID=A0A512BPD9_9HYPH|nr:NUDIX hydrolase [Microvirga aerophila]GEO13819.1 NUDIX hydrolase [Microvirga aerophila]
MLARKRKLRQVGALPLLVNADGGVEVFLVTARGSGRWIIPKGNLIPGLAPHEAATQEAREEAGLIGLAESHCIGTFEFSRRRRGRDTTCLVDVDLLMVKLQMRKWAEAAQRSVLRCNVETALSLVGSSSLAFLIEQHLSPQVQSGRLGPSDQASVSQWSYAGQP